MNHHSVRGDKRERILASAMRVFASKGFFGTKVADVAAAAGVADGTIYLYFKSKDDILISLFEQEMERVNGELRRAVEGAPDGAEKLRRFVRAYMALVEKHPHASEVITIELRQSAKLMKEYKNPRFAEFLKILAGVIDEGQKDGTLRADVPAPTVARAIFGALDELALMWVAAPQKTDLRKAADAATRLVLQGLEPRSPR
jgi:TetR/AcrR family fatty acid metabolism transcriptional regulator